MSRRPRAVPDAASRTAIFATINSTSAFAILVLQVLATGEVLAMPFPSTSPPAALPAQYWNAPQQPMWI